MSKENRAENQEELVAKLQQARVLVDQCIAGLAGKPPRKPKKEPNPPPPRKAQAVPALDFDTSERAFVKTHGRDLSGPKKFVLLLAYLTRGKAGEPIQLKDLEKRWNKMTAPNLLDGKFNRFYSNSAKESGWVNTQKQGVYFLRPSWQDIFK